MGVIIALLSGALMSVQGVLNTEVTKQSSIWTAAGWVQLSDLIVCLVMWWFGGMQPIGAFLIVVAHIIIAFGIELFGLLVLEKADFEWKKVIGALVAIGGIIIFKHSR